jgi:flagellar basal-body rod modification protein FlgD
MATAAAIFAHHATQAQALTGNAVAPMDSSSGSSGSSNGSGDSAVISANDFLTLLVTEMQNQDPTADTDPNEYVDQLVQVNSLEQLISINQTLTGALGTSSSTSGSDAATSKTAAPLAQTTATGAQPAAAHKTGAFAGAMHAPGNLSIPAASPASQRVAHALGGSTHAKSIASRISKTL